MTPAEEDALLQAFRTKHPEFFKKDERRLFLHLASVIALLIVTTIATIFSSALIFKILFGAASSFLWFCLINTTIHHHHTHKNAAMSPLAKNVLNFLYKISMPNAPKRLNRYTRAHLNHHARPFHETDVDHHYGTRRYLAAKSFAQKFFYFLELTFVGGHVPGWEDDRYMNTIPLEQWNQPDYVAMKKIEIQKARQVALMQWGAFLGGLWLAQFIPLLGAVLWGWAFPMLLVKNWAHYLGQFQHYGEKFLQDNVSINQRTKTYRCPSWVNFLAAGEISGHFLHHLFPEMPYYHVERARREMEKDEEFARFIIF